MDYGIDLSGCTKEELIYWDLFADILDNDTSPWHRYAREMGLNHVMEVYLDILLPHPSLKFRLRNGDSCLREAFLDSIRKALKDICRDGLSPKLYRASMKENRLTDSLTREAPHLGFNLSEEIGRYWSTTGRTDYFQLYEEAFRRFEEDSDQAIIKKLAATALHPRASALVVTEPVPGLAEQLEEEKEQYLNEKLASMTAAEQKQLIEETAAFHDWNSRQRSNMDFIIRPQDLPEPAKPCSFTKRQWGTITCYTSPSPSQGVGSYQLYFDISRIEKDDLNYLTLYQMLLTELDTKRFTVEQQKNLEQEYLHDCTFDELYPARKAGPQNHPMMSVFWFGLTEDFEAGLDFLLDVMGGGDYGDTDTIIQVLEKYLPDYDQSKGDNASALAFSLSEGYTRQECRFRNMLNSQENYYFLKDVLKRLKEDPDFGTMAASKLKTISHTILNRRGLVFLAAASPDVLGNLEQAAVDILGRLPVFKEDHDSLAPAIWIPDQKQRLAVCVEASCQETRLMGDFYENPGFKGRYLPFLMAVADKYLKPAIRYQGGAYDSGIDFYIPAGYFSLWSTADPEVRSTQKLFLATGAQLMELPLTRGELDGYILNAYAQALPPSGTLSTRMRHMRRDMVNMDSCKINEMISDIRNADLCHQQEAARIIDEILGRSAIVTVGNEKCIMKDKDVFDQVLIYHTDYA
ncbi:peptidase M16 [Enterocloster clostridioformis]|nr:peptidase M16 [Enterocloster clostridioformis]MCA5578986.1 peptidase M16 [Enterocloster clostridioformis]SQB03878.1 Predicted Zn-dependent peptidases, insulinase-like [Enterocloster clostridioformis]